MGGVCTGLRHDEVIRVRNGKGITLDGLQRFANALKVEPWQLLSPRVCTSPAVSLHVGRSYRRGYGDRQDHRSCQAPRGIRRDRQLIERIRLRASSIVRSRRWHPH